MHLSHLPLLSIASLLIAGIDVYGAPHRHHSLKYSRRVTHADVAGLSGRWVDSKRRKAKRQIAQSSDGPVSVAPSPSVIPLLVAPPPAPTHNATTESPKPTEFAVLFAPPIVKKANKVCTSRTVTSTQKATTTTSTQSTSTSKVSSSSSGSNFVAAYYPDWTSLQPESIDFTRFDWIDFAFAVPNSAFVPTFTESDSTDLLKRLVTAAHAKGKKVKLSVGGWTGSSYFSPAVSTSANRQTFANNILAVYKQFNVDGIDIDWEYPGIIGQAGNAVSSQDSTNYLAFLKVLRATLPTGAVITAATQVWPWAGTNGAPMTDVSQFAKYLDWILLMNYDVWGSSSTPGPNAPLSNACGNSSQPLANAVAAVKSWTDAGMPASKLTLGVPSYGYISMSTATHLTGRSSITVKNEDGGTGDGQIQFNDLINQGVLQKKNGAYVGAGGFTRIWDSCSSTPFLRSAASGQVITYDDPESLQLKAAFVKQAGIKGVNMFDAHGDTSSWELVDALRQGLGII